MPKGIPRQCARVLRGHRGVINAVRFNGAFDNSSLAYLMMMQLERSRERNVCDDLWAR